MPDFFHVVHRHIAQHRHSRLGEPRRNADAQRPGQQFQQRPPARFIEFVEKAREPRRKLRFPRASQRLDDLGKRWRRRSVVQTFRFGRPEQRDRLGQIPHEIVAEGEQFRVDPFGDETTHESRSNAGDRQRARHRGERQAPIGVRRLSKV
jgi:hypothetical protein